MSLIYENLLGSSRYELAKNTDTNIQLSLEEKTKPLTEYNIIDIVNQQTLFEEEREKSNKYRINGKFNIYTSNVLTTGATSSVWGPELFGDELTPTNWVMQITYPSDSNPNYLMEKIKVGGNIKSNAYRGLQYDSLGLTIVNNDVCLTINGIQNHNMDTDEYVYLYSNTSYNSLQGIHKVRNTGIGGSGLTTDLTLYTIVGSNLANVSIPSGSGNFVRIIDPSLDDINFNNPSDILYVTSTDITGSTMGSFSTNEIRYATVKTSTNHDLSINDFVDIRTSSVSTLNGVFRVYNVITGSTTTGSTKFVIQINDPIGPSTVDSIKGNTTTFSSPNNPKWRRLDGTPSEYYVRNFELLTSNDYNVYPCAFSSSVYSDVLDVTIGTANNTWLFQFNQDLDISRLKNNRGGPITDLFYTIIKRAGAWPFKWSDVNGAWEFNKSLTSSSNGLEYISRYNSTGNNVGGTIEKSTPRTEVVTGQGVIVPASGSKYIGDFVEFNCLLLKETTITDVIHRFSTYQNPNDSGYYYKPFKKLEIRKKSNTIETEVSDKNIIGLPTDYVTYADGSIAWRDLLSIGFYEEGTNGVDYPFLNGVNYFYFNYNLYIRLQNPIVTTTTENNYITNINGECS